MTVLLRMERDAVLALGSDKATVKQSGVLLGFVLALVYCRARCSDLARAPLEPLVETLSDQSRGFFQVPMKEWRKAMPAVGIQNSDEMIGKLFELFDEDGSGEIEFMELRAALRKPAMKRGGALAEDKLSSSRSLTAPSSCCTSRCSWSSSGSW